MKNHKLFQKSKEGRYYFINKPFWMRTSSSVIEVIAVYEDSFEYFYPLENSCNVNSLISRRRCFIEELKYGQDYVDSSPLLELLDERESV